MKTPFRGFVNPTHGFYLEVGKEDSPIKNIRVLNRGTSSWFFRRSFTTYEVRVHDLPENIKEVFFYITTQSGDSYVTSSLVG